MSEVNLNVRLGKGLSMVRDANGYPYPEGEFKVRSTRLTRRYLKSGDLVEIASKSETTKKKQ